MANISRISGFQPVRTGLGASWNGQLTQYYVDAATTGAIAVGDLVKLTGNADTNGVRGVQKAAVGDAVIGAVVNVDFNPENLNSPQYRPAGTTRYVYVADDPNTVYEAQISGTVTGGLVGQNANHADAGVSTVTGWSGETVDASTAAGTATLTLKILDFSRSVENEVGANAKVLVKINNHQLANGVAGV